MDLITILQTALTVIGGVSVLLGIIAPLTKTKKDDKVLYWLKKILSMASLNVSEKTIGVKTSTLDIKIKSKK